MRKLRPLAALVVLAGGTWGGGLVSAAPAPPLSSVEAHALPPQTVKRRIVDQLADILLSPPRTTEPGKLLQPLSEIDLYTRGQPTRIAGLCESDAVQIAFAPSGVADDPAATPSHASGLRAQRRFRFVAPPRSPATVSVLRKELMSDAGCAQLDPYRLAFFEASNELEAAIGGAHYMQVLAGLRQAKPPFAVQCASGWDCAAEIAKAADLDSLRSVERCEGEPLRNIGCWSVIVEVQGFWPAKIYAGNDAAAQIDRVVVEDPFFVASDRLE